MILQLSTKADAIRLQENDVEMDSDGGRVVLVADSAVLGRKSDLQQLTVVLNYVDDEPMRSWPTTRQERQDRRFALLVIEGATEEELAQVRQLLGNEPQ